MKIRFLRPFYGILARLLYTTGDRWFFKIEKNAKNGKITKLAKQMFHVKQRKRGANVDFCSKAFERTINLQKKRWVSHVFLRSLWRLTPVATHKANVSRETFVKKWRASANFRKFYEKSKKKRENEQNSCKITKRGSKTVKQVLKKTKTQRSTTGLTSALALLLVERLAQSLWYPLFQECFTWNKMLFSAALDGWFLVFLKELARNHTRFDDISLFWCTKKRFQNGFKRLLRPQLVLCR